MSKKDKEKMEKRNRVTKQRKKKEKIRKKNKERIEWQACTNMPIPSLFLKPILC